MTKPTVERVCWMLVAVLGVAAGLQAASVEATSEIERVTVYRDKALVTRSVRAQVPAGASELVVGPLPNHVLAETLFAAGGGDLEIRAVRYRSRIVSEQPRKELRELDGQIKDLEAALRGNFERRKKHTDRESYLRKLQDFTADVAKGDLSRGVLDADALQQMTLFIFEQLWQSRQGNFEGEEEKRKLEEQLTLAKSKRDQLAKRGRPNVREAMIFISRPQAGDVALKLSYLVNHAGWAPTYSLRAKTGRSEVSCEYNAVIHQMSGEPWNEVQLTLSTAFPTFAASAPGLGPFWVTLGQRQAPQAEELERAVKSYRRDLTANMQAQQQEAANGSSGKPVWGMNLAAGNLQAVELAASQEFLRKMAVTAAGPTAGLSATYPVPGRISLASRSDRQIIQISNLDLEGDFFYVSIPLLTPFVYRHADIRNRSQLPLLAGPATVYLDEQFVGRGAVPLVAPGQKFSAGFGVASHLRAQRRLVEKTDHPLGGNRQVRCLYHLTLENFGEEPATVRLYDRIPTAMETPGLQVTLEEAALSDPLSEDAFYREQERPEGILRWDTQAPAQTAEPDGRRIKYAYLMEFDRNLNVVPAIQAGKEAEVMREFGQRLNLLRKAR